MHVNWRPRGRLTGSGAGRYGRCAPRLGSPVPAPKPMMKRRHAFLLVLALISMGFLGRSAAGSELRFGFTPVLGQSQTKAEFEPLMAYLSGAIGQRVVLYVASD